MAQGQGADTFSGEELERLFQLGLALKPEDIAQALPHWQILKEMAAALAQSDD